LKSIVGLHSMGDMTPTSLAVAVAPRCFWKRRKFATKWYTTLYI